MLILTGALMMRLVDVEKGREDARSEHPKQSLAVRITISRESLQNYCYLHKDHNWAPDQEHGQRVWGDKNAPAARAKNHSKDLFLTIKSGEKIPDHHHECKNLETNSRGSNKPRMKPSHDPICQVASKPADEESSTRYSNRNGTGQGIGHSQQPQTDR